jgi:exoribonuclease R
VQQRLEQLPTTMADADRRAHAADRAVVDATEAALLQHRVGETFSVLVIDADEHAGTVMVNDPPVRARCSGDRLEVGARIDARLAVADVPTRTVRFASGEQLAGEHRHG